MMKSRFTITNIIITAVATIAAIIAMVAVFTPAQAASTDNVFGQAWGASGPSANAPASSVGGIGWVSMNNCTSPSSCSGVDFGVTVSQSGVFSGQAWSSNYGWINFNGASHCPAGAPQVDLGLVASNGSAPITGFAHVTSAGTGDNYWDGCISMSGPNHAVTMDSAGNITGAAWGANVVGWVSFDAVYMIALGCTDPSATNYDPTAVIDDGSCNIPSGSFCVNPPWSSSIVTQQDFNTYNLNNQPVLLRDSNDVCFLKGDLCPGNSAYYGTTAAIDADFGTNMWYYTTNNFGLQTCVAKQGWCPDPGYGFNSAIHFPDNSLCGNPPPPPGQPTIPSFEEI